jgi:hypothetical protein
VVRVHSHAADVAVFLPIRDEVSEGNDIAILAYDCRTCLVSSLCEFEFVEKITPFRLTLFEEKTRISGLESLVVTPVLIVFLCA